MPAESLVDADDSHGEMLYQKKYQIRGEIRLIRLKENPGAAQQAVNDHQRLDRPILKITPRNDQITNGVPKFQVEQDATRREIIANLTHQVLQSLHTREVDVRIVSAR